MNIDSTDVEDVSRLDAFVKPASQKAHSSSSKIIRALMPDPGYPVQETMKTKTQSIDPDAFSDVFTPELWAILELEDGEENDLIPDKVTSISKIPYSTGENQSYCSRHLSYVENPESSDDDCNLTY